MAIILHYHIHNLIKHLRLSFSQNIWKRLRLCCIIVRRECTEKYWSKFSPKAKRDQMKSIFWYVIVLGVLFPLAYRNIRILPFCILQTETHVSRETLILDNLIETILQWDSWLKLSKCNTLQTKHGRKDEEQYCNTW